MLGIRRLMLKLIWDYLRNQLVDAVLASGNSYIVVELLDRKVDEPFLSADTFSVTVLFKEL